MVKSKSKTYKTLDWIASILLLIGGLNWGVVAFGINLVQLIFGVGTALTFIIYLTVGISAFWVFGRVVSKKFMK